MKADLSSEVANSVDCSRLSTLVTGRSGCCCGPANDTEEVRSQSAWKTTALGDAFSSWCNTSSVSWAGAATLTQADSLGAAASTLPYFGRQNDTSETRHGSAWKHSPLPINDTIAIFIMCESESNKISSAFPIWPDKHHKNYAKTMQLQTLFRLMLFHWHRSLVEALDAIPVRIAISTLNATAAAWLQALPLLYTFTIQVTLNNANRIYWYTVMSWFYKTIFIAKLFFKYLIVLAFNKYLTMLASNDICFGVLY